MTVGPKMLAFGPISQSGPIRTGPNRLARARTTCRPWSSSSHHFGSVRQWRSAAGSSDIISSPRRFSAIPPPLPGTQASLRNRPPAAMVPG